MSRAQSAVAFVEEEAFRNACAQFATGIAIATTLAPDGSPHGLTVSSFTSVSLHPPLVSFCIDAECSIIDTFRKQSFFALNILGETQRDLSIIFSMKPEGRFEGIEWSAAQNGSPWLPDCLATMECRTERIIPAGDHSIILGAVIGLESTYGQPLIHFDRAYRSLR